MKKLFALLTVLVAIATRVMAQEAYAVYNDNDPDNRVMTFYYDDQRENRQDSTYSLTTAEGYPEWLLNKTRLFEKAVFDPSFANARPTSTDRWFYLQNKLKTIEGFENLKTDEVTSAISMFFNCVKLKEIDLTGWNTKKLTKTWGMFKFCNNLTVLDLSSWDTSKLTDTGSMFCSCSRLETIYVGRRWNSAGITESEDMFIECSSLVGEKETVYDENHIDASYAHVDGGPQNPGYFTYKPEKFNLWIAGVQMTEENCSNNSFGVSYDPETKTLTIDDDSYIEGDGYPAIEVNDLYGLTIELEGNSWLTSYDAALSIYNNSNVTITGSGTLSLISFEGPAISIGKNTRLILFDTDVDANGADCAIYGTGDDERYCDVVVNHSRLFANSDNHENATVYGLNQFTLVDAKYNNVEVENYYLELFNGAGFNYDTDNRVLRFDGTVYIEDMGRTYDSHLEWDNVVSISPTNTPTAIDASRLNDKGQMINDKGRDGWYTLDGRRLDGVPTAKGVYVRDGRKVVIK